MKEDSTGGRLRKLRKTLGISQEKLAEAAGATRVEVVNWESGRNKMTGFGPRAGLARAFNVTIERISEYLDGEMAMDDILREIQEKKHGAGLDESGEVCLVPFDEPSPARAEAARFARANGVPDEAIVRVCRLPRAPLTAEEWYLRMKATAFELRDAEQAAETANKSSSRRSRAAS